METWLKNHPGIELVTRDRSSAYASAITSACPDAIQVADRWHLLKNLSEAVERFLDTQRSAIQAAVQATTQLPDNQDTKSNPSLTETDLPQPIPAQPPQNDDVVPTEKRYTVYQRTKELQQDGHGIRSDGRCRRRPPFGSLPQYD